MIDKYYVYIYLDPRKKGKFNYDDISLEYEPFYIGKGKGNRFTDHLREAKRTNKNHPKTNKIKKIWKNNKSPIIIKVKDNISEDEAFELEIKLIHIIGRQDLKTGPLTNLCGGGEGISGISEKQRKILSERSKGENNPMFNSQRFGKLNPFYNKKHSKETKEKISKALKGKKINLSEEARLNKSLNMKGKNNINYNGEANNHAEKLGEWQQINYNGKTYDEIFGIEKSKEIKKKMSDSHKGDKCYLAKKWKFIDPKGGIYIIKGEFIEFCKTHNISEKKMRQSLKNNKPVEGYVRGRRSQNSINSTGWICQILT